MTGKRWTIDDLPWERFDVAAVDAGLTALVKAASLVEANAHDYTDYLSRVFADDAAFCAAAALWAEEEAQHGAALGRWAETADPDWSYAAARARFCAVYRPPLDGDQSVRGARTGELVARCIVETGTSSYYAALADACAEPVLKELCRRIAADELRHYKLFYDFARKYQPLDGWSRARRLKVAARRLAEAEDDELACAFYAANAPADAPYIHAVYNNAYAKLAYGLYRRPHLDRALAMAFKASGLSPQSLLVRVAQAAAWRALQARVRRAAAAG